MFRTPISPGVISRALVICVIVRIQRVTYRGNLVLLALILTPMIEPAREWLKQKGLSIVLMVDTRAGRDASLRTGSDRP